MSNLIKATAVMALLSTGSLAAETIVIVNHDKDTFSDNKNVSLIMTQKKDALTSLTLAAICQIDKVAMTVDYGAQFIMEDYAPIQYRIDADKPVTENWQWNSSGQILYKFDPALVERFGKSEKVAIRFADEIGIFEFAKDADKLKEFSDTCAEILAGN